MFYGHLRATAVLVAVAMTGPVFAQGTGAVPPRKPPGTQAPVIFERKATVQSQPQPGEAESSRPPPGDLQPAIHATNAGISTCRQAIQQASTATVDAPHKAYSTWVTAAPNQHVFQSVVGLDYKTKAAPTAVAVITATPTPTGGCDSTTVQVYPTARGCPALRQELLRDGRLTDELVGLPLIQGRSGFQHTLIPSGTGCVIVAVGVGVGAPPEASTPVQSPQRP